MLNLLRKLTELKRELQDLAITTVLKTKDTLDLPTGILQCVRIPYNSAFWEEILDLEI